MGNLARDKPLLCSFVVKIYSEKNFKWYLKTKKMSKENDHRTNLRVQLCNSFNLVALHRPLRLRGKIFFYPIFFLLSTAYQNTVGNSQKMG